MKFLSKMVILLFFLNAFSLTLYINGKGETSAAAAAKCNGIKPGPEYNKCFQLNSDAIYACKDIHESVAYNKCVSDKISAATTAANKPAAKPTVKPVAPTAKPAAKPIDPKCKGYKTFLSFIKDVNIDDKDLANCTNKPLDIPGNATCADLQAWSKNVFARDVLSNDAMKICIGKALKKTARKQPLSKKANKKKVAGKK